MLLSFNIEYDTMLVWWKPNAMVYYQIYGHLLTAHLGKRGGRFGFKSGVIVAIRDITVSNFNPSSLLTDYLPISMDPYVAIVMTPIC